MHEGIGIGFEFHPAGGVAEVVPLSCKLGCRRSVRWIDLHPANGIDRDRRGKDGHRKARSRRPRLQPGSHITGRVGGKSLAASRGAEPVGLPLIQLAARCGRRQHIHSADRVFNIPSFLREAFEDPCTGLGPVASPEGFRH